MLIYLSIINILKQAFNMTYQVFCDDNLKFHILMIIRRL